jgi:hypothetical protein
MQKFNVTFATHSRMHLATVTVNGEKTTVSRTKPAQSLGYHIPASNDGDLQRCALYLSKEPAAVSAVCNGYLVTKE